MTIEITPELQVQIDSTRRDAGLLTDEEALNRILTQFMPNGSAKRTEHKVTNPDQERERNILREMRGMYPELHGSNYDPSEENALYGDETS